jgi:hypothetical protein
MRGWRHHFKLTNGAVRERLIRIVLRFPETPSYQHTCSGELMCHQQRMLKPWPSLLPLNSSSWNRQKRIELQLKASGPDIS